MPNYIITIHLKIGKPRMGVRWHPSYDLEHVKTIVEQKIKISLGTAIVEMVHVALAPLGFKPKGEVKSLVQ